MNVAELLRDPNSKYFLVPLTVAVLGVLAKWISSNDKVGIRRPSELFYLSPNLLVANFIMIICEFSKYALVDKSKQQLFHDSCFSALMFNIGASIAITLWIRMWGWNTYSRELRLWRGILLPDLFAIAVMYFVFRIMVL